MVQEFHKVLVRKHRIFDMTRGPKSPLNARFTAESLKPNIEVELTVLDPNEVPEVVVPVDLITPDTAVEFDRIAPYKKPVRKAPSVSLEGDGYLRLEDVLTVYPVSRSAWYEGIKQGIYPAPVPLGRRSVGWSRAAIRALVESPPKF